VLANRKIKSQIEFRISSYLTEHCNIMNITQAELAIRSILLEKYPVAVKSRIAENYTALFAEDVTYIPFDGPECHSKEEMTSFFNSMMAQFRIEPVLKVEKIKIYDNLKDAYVIGKSFAKLTPMNGGDFMEMTFRAIWIFTVENGEWKIARQIWNTAPTK